MDITKYNFLIPLIVVIPLFLGVFVLLLRNALATYIMTVSVTFSVLCILIFLFIGAKFNTLVYHLSSFAPPYGIEYKISSLNFYFVILVALIGFLVAVWSKCNLKKDIAERKSNLFYSMFLLCFAGNLGLLVTNDLFNLFVMLEITSITSYVLIALSAKKQAPVTALNYLIVGSIAASFYVFGVGILYLLSGTLNMDDMIKFMSTAQATPLLYLAVISIVLGLIIKIGVFPLMWWIPKVYETSPATVSTYLAGTSINIAFYIFIKVLVTVLGATSTIDYYSAFNLLVVLGICGMFVGGVYALRQDNIKLLLAYSSISQMGFIVVGFALFNAFSVYASLYMVMVHALIKTGLFLCVGNMIAACNTEKLSELKGLGHKFPLTYYATIFLCLSLASFPGTSLFWGKVYLFISTMSTYNLPVIISIVLASVLSFLYCWKIISTLCSTSVKVENITVNKISPCMQFSVLVIVALNILIMAYPGVVFFYVEQIVNLNLLAKG